MGEHNPEIERLKRYEQRMLIQYEVRRELAGAVSLEAAAAAIVKIVATQLDCQAGFLWKIAPDGQTLRCVAHWEKPSDSDSGFGAACAGLAISRGDGLAGRVWHTQAPIWIEDLFPDDCLPRLHAAAERGVRSAFAFPILLGAEVYGAMEFFAQEVRPLDSEVLQTGASLGYQIGEFLERIRAQQQVAERDENYRVLAETSFDGILTIDAASTILFANTAAARIFGYSADELIGTDLTALLTEQFRPTYRAEISRQAIRVSGQHREGYEIPIEISLGEFQRENAHTFVAVIRDIRERVRLDDALMQSTRLESLGVLFGGVAYDLNNLLTGVLGNASLALQTLGDAHPVAQVLRDAIEASERAANLSKQAVSYAGGEVFPFEPVDISSVVQPTCDLIEGSIPKHVKLRLDLQQPLPLVDADESQVQALIMNLVTNGVEAIPEHRQGAVVVSTRSQEVRAEDLAALDVAGVSPGNYVILDVHDNGAEMDGAMVRDIFDPPFMAKFPGRMGLAAAVAVVRKHRGFVKVLSSPGQGTTFRILLPVSTAFLLYSVTAIAPSESAEHGLVLVVDDAPVIRKMAARGLESYGYTVITAADGREGLKVFQDMHERLSLVILDMTMPVMSGEEALREMRLVDSRIPILLSSGFSVGAAMSRFAGKGIVGFLQKPYNVAMLGEKVRKILHGSEESPGRQNGN